MWNIRGLELARTLRNQFNDDVDVWYMYPFEDNSHECDEVLILRSSKQYLLLEAKQAIIAEGVDNIEKWMEIVESFISQCPYDSIFDDYTTVCFIEGV